MVVQGSITTDTLAAGAVTIDKIDSDLKSDGYQEGVSGWRIRKSGEMEVANLKARGSLITAQGTNPTGFRCEVGGDPDYVIWAGSGPKNDAGAVWYIKTNGETYFRASVTAGAISSSIQNTLS